MSLQKCDSCNTNFKWKVIYLSLIKGYKPIQCSKCSTEHKITFTSRLIVVGLTILPMLIFAYFLSPFNDFTTIMISIIMAIIGSLFTPFLVKYE
ncbi:TIGR04104 family putative zinc finger protein [Psychrobacillus sp. PGGUH221]|uniref:TIGR04104 family putative zinc finger protein n=1 Tax=Psychrobacillus sp. PGGUH221 TaxID=3020058 RepID=UPI0035C686DD